LAALAVANAPTPPPAAVNVEEMAAASVAPAAASPCRPPLPEFAGPPPWLSATRGQSAAGRVEADAVAGACGPARHRQLRPLRPKT